MQVKLDYDRVSNLSMKRCYHSSFITHPVGQFQYVQIHGDCGFHFMKCNDSCTGFDISKEILVLMTAFMGLPEYD